MTDMDVIIQRLVHIESLLSDLKGELASNRKQLESKFESIDNRLRHVEGEYLCEKDLRELRLYMNKVEAMALDAKSRTTQIMAVGATITMVLGTAVTIIGWFMKG